MRPQIRTQLVIQYFSFALFHVSCCDYNSNSFCLSTFVTYITFFTLQHTLTCVFLGLGFIGLMDINIRPEIREMSLCNMSVKQKLTLIIPLSFKLLFLHLYLKGCLSN